MEISKGGCVLIIIGAAVVLMIIGYLQDLTDGYFLGIVGFSAIAFFIGRELGKDSRT